MARFGVNLPVFAAGRGAKAAIREPSRGAAEGTAMQVWQRMLSDRRLDLANPSPLDIEIEDIAHGLARIARWNGQTKGDWSMSVAEHSVLVERLAGALGPREERRWLLAALLHDAPEYVLGDMIGPLKALLGREWAELEERLQAAVHGRFGLPEELPERVRKLIKRADRTAAWLEATQLAGYTQREAGERWQRPRARSLRAIRLSPLPPGEAAEAFLRRFRQLCDQRSGSQTLKRTRTTSPSRTG